MNLVTILGLIAATLTTCSFVPQVFKIVKTKETRDISLWMYLILAIGIILWLVYGIMIHALPLILANSVSLIFIFVVLAYKIRGSG